MRMEFSQSQFSREAWKPILRDNACMLALAIFKPISIVVKVTCEVECDAENRTFQGDQTIHYQLLPSRQESSNLQFPASQIHQRH